MTSPSELEHAWATGWPDARKSAANASKLLRRGGQDLLNGTGTSWEQYADKFGGICRNDTGGQPCTLHCVEKQKRAACGHGVDGGHVRGREDVNMWNCKESG